MMKTSLEISISNNQEAIEINELKSLQMTELMTDCALLSPEILGHSVLFDIDCKNFVISYDLMFCDDQLITEINSEYRAKDKPTDVITFALFADSPECRIITDNTINLGEIIISADTAMRQAQENDKTLEEEFYFLISHGVLHLLGFEHENDEKLEFMLNLQDKMIKYAQDNLV
ncbi:MAG: rRNA maturation RNase YbeY [bacterium]